MDCIRCQQYPCVCPENTDYQTIINELRAENEALKKTADIDHKALMVVIDDAFDAASQFPYANAGLTEAINRIKSQRDEAQQLTLALAAKVERSEVAMRKAKHALSWSEPIGGESCDGTVTEDQSNEWHKEANDALDSAISDDASTVSLNALLKEHPVVRQAREVALDYRALAAYHLGASSADYGKANDFLAALDSLTAP
jgi:hypothetical protein